jgi:hypothetical protein
VPGWSFAFLVTVHFGRTIIAYRELDCGLCAMYYVRHGRT